MLRSHSVRTKPRRLTELTTRLDARPKLVVLSDPTAVPHSATEKCLGPSVIEGYAILRDANLNKGSYDKVVMLTGTILSKARPR